MLHVIRASAGRAVLLAAVLLTAGCREPADSGGQKTAPAAMTRQPSAEERSAAAALSLLSGDLEEGQSAYAQAVNCTAALRALNERFKESNLIGAAEKQAIEQAALSFAAQARQRGPGEGKSAAQVSEDLASADQQAAESPDLAARSAMACVRSATSAT